MLRHACIGLFCCFVRKVFVFPANSLNFYLQPNQHNLHYLTDPVSSTSSLGSGYLERVSTSSICSALLLQSCLSNHISRENHRLMARFLDCDEVTWWYNLEVAQIQ